MCTQKDLESRLRFNRVTDTASFELRVGREKVFCSAGASLSEDAKANLTLAEVDLAMLMVGKKSTKGALMAAFARGALTEGQFRGRLTAAMFRYDALIKSVEKVKE